MQPTEGVEDRIEALETKVERLEFIISKLIGDKAIGNVLKGPFRLPDRAFQ